MVVGDIVKGLPGSPYGVTNQNMTRGLVVDVDGNNIKVKILEHTDGDDGTFHVDAKHFEVIGHVKPFDRESVIAILQSTEKGSVFEYNLSGANLSGAYLSGANLSDANLSDANLSGANLSGAYLRRANLSGANLSDANLSGAYLSGADLSDANLSGANLSGANLSDANLRRANLSGAYLSGAYLRRANLSGANLSGANLSDANLSDADGLMSSIAYIDAHFERVEKGFIVYKTFGGKYAPPSKWTIAPESIIEENVNPCRTDDCGCGINVAPLEWVKKNYRGDIWKCLIEWAWLPGVVVPYGTDGKIRCERVRLLEKV